ELRRSATGHEVGKDLVVAGFRKRYLNGPGSILLLFGMDMLKEFHVLADDEQMVLALMNDLEFLDGLAGSRMENPEQQLRLLSWFYDGRHGSEVEPVVPNIERGGANKVHAAARALSGNIHRVVPVHRAHPGRVALRFLRDRRNRE